MLPESRWAELDEEEAEACANWELWREKCLETDKPVPPAWMDLNGEGKAQARKDCPVAWFGEVAPAIFEPGEIFGSQTGDEMGQERFSAEILELGVHWDRDDGELKKAFSEWLKRQRRTNRNAKSFKPKRKGRNAVSVWSFLLRLAMLRAVRNQIPKAVAKAELRDLAKKVGGGSRLPSKYFMEEVQEAEHLIRYGRLKRSRRGKQ